MAEEDVRCAGLTARGGRCHNAAQPGSLFCRLHQTRADVEHLSRKMSRARGSPGRPAGRSSRSPARRSPEGPPRTAGATQSAARLDALGDPALEQICRELIRQDQLAEAAELSALCRRFHAVCQPLLRAERRPRRLERFEELDDETQRRVCAELVESGMLATAAALAGSSRRSYANCRPLLRQARSFR